MTIYYQLVVKTCPKSLPFTLKRKYRKEWRAIDAMNRFIKKGIPGCLVTFSKDALIDTKEF